jgi:hypothetical protein
MSFGVMDIARASGQQSQCPLHAERCVHSALHMILRALTLVLALPSLASCGRSLPTPRTGPQPENAFIEVPYPPPPARVEVLPKQPHAGAVWVDGQWLWQGQRWIWSPGGWVAAPARAYFAPWALERASDGRLRFAPPSWRDDRGHEIPAPPVLAVAIGEETAHAARCP